MVVISFIIPAHDEAELIGRTLVALHSAAQATNERYEIIVVDDASNDDTSDLALEQGAHVVSVNFRRIASTRNAGARAAIGDVLFFVDADTLVPVDAVSAALLALRTGAIGGGANVRLDGKLPLYGRILERMMPILLPLLKIAPGCFLFCTREAFLAANGFDETLAWREEIGFVKRLRRHGQFVFLREEVVTSGRKIRAYSAAGLFRVGVQLALGRGEGLDYWYGPRENSTEATDGISRNEDVPNG
jgi:glycosyltransferase involved in cell wall biosynthesis